jgi:hypothetical protein
MNVVARTLKQAIGVRLTSTIVDLPVIVFGEPRYDIDDVTRYIKETLEARGYHVETYRGVPSVAIDWAGPRSETRAPGRDKFDIGL